MLTKIVTSKAKGEAMEHNQRISDGFLIQIRQRWQNEPRTTKQLCEDICLCKDTINNVTNGNRRWVRSNTWKILEQWVNEEL